MTGFDFIIAGGGVAGLCLAYEISLSSLHGQKILIIDRDMRQANGHVWRYWADEATRFDHLVYRSWEQVEVINSQTQEIYNITPYRYCMVRAIDFFDNLHQVLSKDSNVTFRQAHIDQVLDARDPGMAQVITNQEPVGSRFAFDSTYSFSDFTNRPRIFHYLKKQIRGWEIETATDCFDPRIVTLYDFRIPQNGYLRYFSILPLTRRRARVEHILFSPSTLRWNEYDHVIGNYLEKVRRIDQYRITGTEYGLIPLTDRPTPRRLGRRVMAIGTRGGLIKPSTGDAFLRIQKDSQAVVNSLSNTGSPFQVRKTPLLIRITDLIMMYGLQQRGNQMADFFTRMFWKHPIQEWFGFADENMSPLKGLGLVSPILRLP